MLNFSFLLLTVFLFSLKSHGRVSLNTQCVKNGTNGQIEGFNINTPYTIASVTKVFTSHWAAVRLGPRYRFSTLIHITPVRENIYNLHIEGVLFPYFDRSMYQFLIGELNRIGIRSINNLTYDENFIYATDIRYNPTLAHNNGDRDIFEIMKDLRRDTQTLNNDLAALNAKVLSLENLKLPEILSVKINDIHFLEKKAFQPSSNTVTLSLPSSELYRNLKEMNRNSNNFVADKLFRKLSEQENYLDFTREHLVMVKPEEITLYNGSGFPIINNGRKYYNEASCATVVEMLADFRHSLAQSQMDLKDVLPVAGKDSLEDGDSTVTRIYGSEITAAALIGKTGSVLDTIALSGLVVTENEDLFFQTSFNIDNTTEDRLTTYTKIREWLTNVLIRDKKKTDLILYKPKAFLPFDNRSQLRKIESYKILN